MVNVISVEYKNRPNYQLYKRFLKIAQHSARFCIIILLRDNSKLKIPDKKYTGVFLTYAFNLEFVTWNYLAQDKLLFIYHIAHRKYCYRYRVFP